MKTYLRRLQGLAGVFAEELLQFCGFFAGDLWETAGVFAEVFAGDLCEIFARGFDGMFLLET